MRDTDWRPSFCPICGHVRAASEHPTCEHCRNKPVIDIQASRITRSEAAAVSMVAEGLRALSADKAVSTVYALICDHPGVTAGDLERLGNLLGRAAHERARGCASS